LGGDLQITEDGPVRKTLTYVHNDMTTEFSLYRGSSALYYRLVPKSAPIASEAEILTLRERAAAFWAARVAGDFDTQWQYLEPRWRGRLTAEEYASDLKGGGRYLAYEVEGATVKGYFATVKVRLLVQQVLPPSALGRVRASPQATVVEDGWIRIRGVWYRRADDGGRVPVPAGQP